MSVSRRSGNSGRLRSSSIRTRLAVAFAVTAILVVGSAVGGVAAIAQQRRLSGQVAATQTVITDAETMRFQIADATGGQSFFPHRIEDVAIGFRNIEEELRSQYLLVYTPADFKRDGSFRTIYLHSLDPRYSVRAKKGYFSPKD